MIKQALSLMLALSGLCDVSLAQEVKAADAAKPAVAADAAKPAVAADASKGAGKAAMCIGCHGIVGYQASFPEIYRVPMIAGQGGKYIVSALQAYAKGDRKHPTMRAIAGSLSDDDMADLAAYYENQGKGGATVAKAAEAAPAPPPEALKVKLAVCVACHGANYSTPIDPTYPRLAGQHADYLRAALRSYHVDGNPNVGRNNAVMRGQVVQEAGGKKTLTFSNAEVKQVAAYLASLPGELKVVPQTGWR